MASEILQPQNSDSPPAPSAEVEFALVIARMIDSAKDDPEYMRSAVYELARHKLKEQFGSDESIDFNGLAKSLEVAIQGVESFKSKDLEFVALPPPPGSSRQGRMLPPPLAEEAARPSARTIKLLYGAGASGFAVLWRLAAVIAIVAIVVFAFRQQGLTIEVLRDQVNRIAAVPAKPVPVQQKQLAKAEIANREPAPPPSPLTPTAYGIYAISQDKLYELQLLPGRAPDARVAVSAAITAPSKTTLPDGHLKFVVYRRDSATNAADRAEVRLVAKVAQETTFNPAGKAVLAKVDDTWVIRNISVPFRTAPSKDSPDMYEVQREDDEAALTPGRYALVIKGQAYDFSVAGQITDRRQCLERLAASNGQFYSECQKP